MNTKPQPCLLILLFIPLCFSCHKSNPAPPPSFSPGADVYMAGVDSNAAVYWKNGRMVQLSPDGRPTGIAVSANGDVYVCGIIDSTPQLEVAVYWKNGVRVTLASDKIITTGQIAVIGTDVYVTGTRFLYSPGASAVYWKNGVQVNLTAQDKFDQSSTNALAVSGSDIYIAGTLTTTNGQGFDTTVIWKDGVIMPTPFDIGGTPFWAIAFNGSDMYVTGVLNGYLKNGSLVQPPQSIGIGEIAFSGQDVYALGGIRLANGGNDGACWKNNDIVMKFDSTGINPINSEGIAATGTDFYIVGNIYNKSIGQSSAVYWKNGVQETLAQNGDITAITIVPN